MKNRILTLVAVVAASFNVAHAERFHVSKSGNDANNGLSWGAAWSTAAKVQSTAGVGDTVLFGTGTWYDVMLRPPAGGSNSNWTVYACSSWYHGTSASAKLAGKNRAILYGGHPVTGWVQHSGNIYKAPWVPVVQHSLFSSYLGVVYNMIQNQDSMLVFVEPGMGSLNLPGEFWHSRSPNPDTLYCIPYGQGDPDNYGMIASAAPVFLMNANGTSHVRVWGLDLRGGGGGGTILFDDSSPLPESTFFEHCHISRGAYTAGENGSAVLVGNFSDNYDGNGYYNCLRACSLGWNSSASLDGGGTPPSSGWRHGGAITVYASEHFLVDSCYFYGFARMGLDFKCDNLNFANPYTGNVCRYTTFYDPSRHYEYALGLRVEQEYDSVYGCTFVGSDQSIYFDADATFAGSNFQRNTFIGNNTFYNVGQAITVVEQAAGACQGGNNIRYNLVHDYVPGLAGYGPGMVHLSSSVASSCMSGFMFDSNAYYDSNGDYDWRCGGSALNFAAWKTCAGGKDLNSISGVGALLTSPSGRNYSPTALVPNMNRTYGGRTWTRWGAVQSNVPVVPVANFSANPLLAVVNLPVQFTDLSTGTITSWSWSFGDGTTSTLQHPLKTYLLIDTYTVSLTVSGPAGSNGHSKPNYVSVLPPGLDVIAPGAITTLALVQSGSNAALGGAVTVCESFSGYSAAELTDGNLDGTGTTSTTWSSEELTGHDHWAYVTLPSGTQVNRVRVYWAWNAVRSAWMTSSLLRVQRWDGTQFVDITSLTDPTPGEYTEVSFSTVTSTRIRILQPSGEGAPTYPNVLWLAELQAYTP